MRPKKLDPQIDLLIRLLDQAYGSKAWHGTTLRGSIRGLPAREALLRPAPGRHNVWELVLHAAYWKYIVRRKLNNEPKSGFPRKGSDWPLLPARPDPRAWKRDVALLAEEHKRLREAVEYFPPARLNRLATDSKWTNAELMYGVASHDLYHTGQIQLVKRLMRT